MDRELVNAGDRRAGVSTSGPGSLEFTPARARKLAVVGAARAALELARRFPDARIVILLPDWAEVDEVRRAVAECGKLGRVRICHRSAAAAVLAAGFELVRVGDAA